MNDKTKRVIAGWLNLSESEKAVFEREIGRIRNAHTWQEGSAREELTTVVMNASSDASGEGCPCCGR